MRIVVPFCLLPLLWALAACKPPPVPEIKPWRLLEAPWAATWQQAGIPDEGAIQVVQGELILAAGQPMTGAKFSAWQAPEFPGTHYVIRYEAMRVEGEDFFGTLTFPVGSHASHASFVLGGWGGTVTGISSIDFSDANENQTRAETAFENNRWYRVRLEVRPDDLRVWVDERPMVNVSIKGRKVGLRSGFIDHCRPLGFATYGSKARIRNVILERLPDSSL
jgi:hypothetical protein